MSAKPSSATHRNIGDNKGADQVRGVVIGNGFHLARVPRIDDLAVGDGVALAIGAEVYRFRECVIQIELDAAEFLAERPLHGVVTAGAAGAPGGEGRILRVEHAIWPQIAARVATVGGQVVNGRERASVVIYAESRPIVPI